MSIDKEDVKNWHKVYKLYVKSLYLTMGDHSFLLSIADEFVDFVDNFNEEDHE